MYLALDSVSKFKAFWHHPLKWTFLRIVYTQRKYGLVKGTGDNNVGVRDTQQHILICKVYAKFRKGKDLSYDKDLVEYFGNVLRSE